MSECIGYIVASTGRCGSTLVSNLLNDCPGMLSLSEFFTTLGGPALFSCPDMDGAALWQKLCRVSRASKAMLQAGNCPPEILADVTREPFPEPLELITLPHLAKAGLEMHEAREVFRASVESQPYQPVQEHLRKIFQSVSASLGEAQWVERSGGSLSYISELLDCFPKAKFVHLYRGGMDTALSMSKHDHFRLLVGYHILRGTPTVSDVLACEVPLSFYGRYWSDQVVEGVSRLECLAPERVLHVQYERLVAEPGPQLQRLYSFMGVSAGRTYLEHAVAQVKRPEPRVWLDTPAVDSLREACEPGMAALSRLV